MQVLKVTLMVAAVWRAIMTFVAAATATKRKAEGEQIATWVIYTVLELDTTVLLAVVARMM